MMERRTFLGTLAGGLFAAPLAAEAHTAGKEYRVGLIFPSPPVSEMTGPEPVNNAARAFVRALRALGYVEGRNLILERRSAEGRSERFAPIVAELVRLNVDVIVVSSVPLAQRAREVTTAVPIVMGAGTYTKIVPQELLKFSFGDRAASVEFVAGVNGVTVRVTFDAESGTPIEQQRQGWQAMLNTFAKHVEASR
jgi:hypothetical protein